MKNVPIEFKNQNRYVVHLSYAGGHPILHLSLYWGAFNNDPEYRCFIDDEAIDIWEALTDLRSLADEKGAEVDVDTRA